MDRSGRITRFIVIFASQKIVKKTIPEIIRQVFMMDSAEATGKIDTATKRQVVSINERNPAHTIARISDFGIMGNSREPEPVKELKMSNRI